MLILVRCCGTINEVGRRVECGEVLGFHYGTEEHGISDGLCKDCFERTLRNSDIPEEEVRKMVEEFKQGYIQ